jgi:hypothetical protein
MPQILIIIGAAIFGILGALHLFFTFFGHKLEPFDSNVVDAMKGTNPRLTRETTMWKAWIGFNASHSLGAILVAAFYIPLSVWHFDLIRQSLWFSLMPAIIGLSYLCLAKKYWFKVPLLSILIATVCFCVATTLIHL